MRDRDTPVDRFIRGERVPRVSADDATFRARAEQNIPLKPTQRAGLKPLIPEQRRSATAEQPIIHIHVPEPNWFQAGFKLAVGFYVFLMVLATVIWIFGRASGTM